MFGNGSRMKTKQALEAHQEQLKLSGEYGIAMVLIVHEGGDFDSVGPEGSEERELAKSLLRGYANRVCFWQPQSTLQNAVAATDRAIDALVYELYGLTPEEIALVEGAS